MEQALARGGNRAFTGHYYERASHGITEWRLPYGLPPPWFPSGYVADQVEWVVRAAAANPP